MRRPYVYYVARLSYAPLCTPGAESGTGQNNVTARAVTRGCKRKKNGEPFPVLGCYTPDSLLCAFRSPSRGT